MLRWVLAVLLVSAVALAGEARADSITLDFERITSNATENVASQFSVVVSDNGDGNVLFIVSNDGPIASSICDVYWGPEAALSDYLSSTVTMGSNTGTVSFSNIADPSSLPGGTWTAGASADSDPAVSPNGIGVGETGGFLIARLSGVDWETVRSKFLSGDLRMGLKVQSIGAGGQSDGFESVVPVPEPATLAMLGLGLAGLAARRRRHGRNARA